MAGRTIAWLLMLGLIVALLATALTRSEVLVGRIETPIGETRDHLTSIEAKLLAIDGRLDDMEATIIEIGEHARGIEEELEPINRGISGGATALAAELGKARRWLDDRLLLALLFAAAAVWIVKL